MQFTNVGIQKIDSTTLETYTIVVVIFSIIYEAHKVRFFDKIFLVVNINLGVVFGMFFFTLSGRDIHFPKKKL